MPAQPPISSDLLLRHEPFLRRLAQRLVRDESTALDLVQETLLRALESPLPAAGEPSHLPRWLARILRNRAIDRGRGETRRRRREEARAPQEALESGPSSLERLEVSRGVIAAVLALEEPYRGVVLETFYEERSPAQIAERRGIPASTVRAQLSRALAQLRARLDQEHGGDRRAWSVALLFAAQPRLEAAAATSSPALLWLATAGVAAAGALVAYSVLQQPRADLQLDGAALPVAAPEHATDNAVALQTPAAPEQVNANRAPLTAQENQDPVATPAERIDALVTRARQVRREALARLLRVDPELESRYAFASADGQGDVIHLLDRQGPAKHLSLPWLQEGGASYSFTQRSHDYQSDAQIGWEGPWLNSGFAGHTESLWLDLGPGMLRPGNCESSAALRAAVPSPLEPSVRALLSSPFSDESGRRLPDHTAPEGAVERSIQWRIGHCYLLRNWDNQETEIVALIEVLGVSEGRMTLAWRLLEHREFERRWPMYVSPVQSKDVPPAPAELTALSTADLFNELTRLQAEIRPLTLEVDRATLPERLTPLLGRTDAGLFHLTSTTHGASELITERGGGAYYSLATRSHSYNDEPDISLQGQHLRAGFYGGTCAALIDLGPLPLNEAQSAISQLPQPLLDLLYLDPLKPESGDAPSHERDFPNHFREVAQKRRIQLTGLLPATPGHTFVLRNHLSGEHDLLAAIELVAWTPSGALFAYQILSSWPVDPR